MASKWWELRFCKRVDSTFMWLFIIPGVRKGWCRVKDTKTDFDCILIQLHTKEVFFPSLWFPMETSQTQGFSFHALTQDISAFFLIFALFHNFFLSLFSVCIKFNLGPFCVWPLYSGKVQSLLGMLLDLEWITLVFEVSPLKELLKG